MGYLLNKTTLLIPSYPTDQEIKADLLASVKSLGYKMTKDGFRDSEGFGGTTLKRITCACDLLFGLMREEAYLGTLLQYLVAQISFKFHMLQPYILLKILEVSGRNLQNTYRVQMKSILEHLSRGY